MFALCVVVGVVDCDVVWSDKALWWLLCCEVLCTIVLWGKMCCNTVFFVSCVDQSCLVCCAMLCSDLFCFEV